MKTKEIRNKGNLPFVSIVVPTYQEAANLQTLILRIAKVMSGRFKDRYEIIIVDDNSKDGTDGVIRDLAAQGYPVRLIIRLQERGLSTAVIRGFQGAKGNFLVCMDADLSHPPEAIPQLLDCFDDEEVDFVLGSRYISGGSTDGDWGLFRWLNSKVATLLAKPFVRVKDPMSGFFALRRSVFYNAIDLNPIGYKIGLELMVKCGCRKIREIPIHFINRRLGQSKMDLSQQINYLRHLKRLADYKYGELSRFLQFCFV